jgi:hypothetical protein
MINSREPKGEQGSAFSKEKPAPRLSRRPYAAYAPALDMTAIRLRHVARPTPCDGSRPARTNPIAPSSSSVSVRDVLRTSQSGAADSAERLVEATARIAARYRACALEAAENDFSRFLAALRKLAHVTAILITSAGSLESRNHLDVVVTRLHWIFDAIAQHKEARRWYAVAELIDTDLVAVLDRWTAILKALPDEHDTGASNADAVDVGGHEEHDA